MLEILHQFFLEKIEIVDRISSIDKWSTGEDRIVDRVSCTGIKSGGGFLLFNSIENMF